MAECNTTYKIILLGDSSVGKTCLIRRYCDDFYVDKYAATVGIDSKQKIITVDGAQVKMEIKDTAGQERFRTVMATYYRRAMGILLMYDVTRIDSFNNLTYWLHDIKEYASPGVVIVLAGNKFDEVSNRSVDYDCGQKIAEYFDMPFYEVSCKQNINIDEAFLTLARLIRDNPCRQKVSDTGEQPKAFKLSNEEKSDDSCCKFIKWFKSFF